MNTLIARLAATASATLIVVGATTHTATAQTVGSDCGTTVTTSCSSTSHYSAMDQWLGGTPTAPDCPDYLNDDWGHEVGTGNGIVHVNVDKDGDEWVTNTWTGDASISFYSRSDADIVTDSDGNVVSANVTGPAEHVLTGRSTTWFGASFNNRNSVVTFTFSFEGTDEAGNVVRVHGEEHQMWLPGADPDGMPSMMQMHFNCS
jgi:hypothetical protein